MGRGSIMLAVFAVVLTGWVAVGRTVDTGAQEGTPVTARHPLVGAWVLDLDEDGGRLFTFAADGTALFTDLDGTTGHGAWEATGDRTARFTTFSLSSAEDPQIEDNLIFEGYFALTAEVAVDPAGDAWTGDLTAAGLDRANVVRFTDGPFPVSATRAPVLPADRLGLGTAVAGIPAAGTPTP